MKVMSEDSTVVDNRSWLKRQFESLPEWARTVMFFAFAGLIMWLIINKQVPPPTINVNPPAVVTEVKEPEVVTGLRLHPAKRLFVDLVKHRAKKALTTDGFNLVGGSPTALTEVEADRLLNLLDDETVLEGAVSTGILKDSGSVLDRLSNLVDWLLANKDKINELVKWIMEILMLFH